MTTGYVITRTCGKITDRLSQLWEGNDLPTFMLGRDHAYVFDDKATAERVMWRLQARHAMTFGTPHFPSIPITYRLVEKA
jgi:hypothetical protein